MASAPTPTPAASSGMASNVAGALCYTPFVALIIAIVFLVIEPQKNDRFVRFHAFQSIFLCIACVVVLIAWGIVAGVMISVIGFGALGILAPVSWLIRLAILAVFLFLMYKAYSNEQFKLPVIGDLAAKQAGA